MELSQLKSEHEALLQVTDFTATPEVYIHQSGKIQETSKINISGGMRMAQSICEFLNENKMEVISRCQKDAELDLLAAQEAKLLECKQMIETLTPQIAAAKLAISEPIEILTPK